MKKGRTLTELAVEIERQCQSKKDFTAETSLIQMEKDGTITLKDTGNFGVRDNAHGQVSSRLKIPKQYYDRMLSDSPELLAANVNHWFQSNPEKRMIRTLDGKIRAFMSEKYRTLDNYDLMATALPILQENETNIISCEVTDSRLYIKALFPQFEQKVDGSTQKNDLVQAGICISNSEVGAGSLRVEPLIYRLVCTNGMIANTAMRKYHVGKGQGTSFEEIQEVLRDETKQLSDKAFWMQVQDVIRSSINEDIFKANVARLSEATQNKIEGDPVKVVATVRKTFTFNETHQSDIMRHLIEGGDLSQWGLANAVTRTANDQADYETATALERAGGKIIDLGQAEWKTLSKAA